MEHLSKEDNRKTIKRRHFLKMKFNLNIHLQKLTPIVFQVKQVLWVMPLTQKSNKTVGKLGLYRIN